MISKNPLDEEVLKKLFDLFFEVVGKRKNQNDFRQIINEILSETERIMTAKRIAIIYLLIKKIDYKIICDVLKVSASTVFKFRFLLKENNKTVSIISRMIKNEKVAEFLEEIILTLYGPGTPGVDWSRAKINRLKFERKKTTGI